MLGNGPVISAIEAIPVAALQIPSRIHAAIDGPHVGAEHHQRRPEPSQKQDPGQGRTVATRRHGRPTRTAGPRDRRRGGPGSSSRSTPSIELQNSSATRGGATMKTSKVNFSAEPQPEQARRTEGPPAVQPGLDRAQCTRVAAAQPVEVAAGLRALVPKPSRPGRRSSQRLVGSSSRAWPPSGPASVTPAAWAALLELVDHEPVALLERLGSSSRVLKGRHRPHLDGNT